MAGVRVMRLAIINKLFLWLLRLAIYVLPKPVAPSQRRWEVRLPGDAPHVTTTLMFRQGHLPNEAMHVSAVVEHPEAGQRWLVDAGQRGWMHPIASHITTTDVVALAEPTYIVTVHCPLAVYNKPSFARVGPHSCVEMARRLCGLPGSRIISTHNLLSELWRLRHGRV